MPENQLIDNKSFAITIISITVIVVIARLLDTEYEFLSNFLTNTGYYAVLGLLGAIIFICILTYLILKIFHLVQYLLVRRKIIRLKQEERATRQKHKNNIIELSKEIDKIFLEVKQSLNGENTLQNKQNLERTQKKLLQSKFKDLELHNKRIKYIQQVGNKIREIKDYLKSVEKAILDKEEQRLKELNVEKGYFKGARLSDYDKKLLLKKGFAQLRCNEFSGRGNPIYFLKPRDKETPEHFFLVRHTQEYLENKGIKVETPEKRDADVVFEIKGVTYAIEVETGSYPESKPEEFENKIKQLNEKYENNWIFLVTNVELVSRYKRHNDKTYHREQMLEVLDKLNNETQQKL